MMHPDLMPNASSVSQSLVSELEMLGLILVSAEPGTSALQMNAGPLRRMLLESAMVQSAIRELRHQWNLNGRMDAIEVCPGLKVYPIAVPRRRRSLLHAFLIVPLDTLPKSEFLHPLLHSAKMDEQTGRSILASIPLASVHESGRLAGIVRLLVENYQRSAEGGEELDKMGRELAESYEELNLLYSTIRNMTVVDQPDRFVQLAARELHETLSFRWILVALVDDVDHLKRLAGRTFLVGDTEHGGVARDFARVLTAHIDPSKPMVLDCERPGPVDIPMVLGDSLVVQPICGSEGDLLGLFIAGHKQGDDERISSADIKLMGATAVHTAVFLENAALYVDLNATILGTLEALTASIDAKDPYTSGHSQRVAHLTRQLAVAVDLPEAEIRKAHIAGLVHDVGKIGVPESVLTKPGRLTDQEFEWIRKHPEIGHRILRDIPQFRDLLPGVLHHHERWDGAGYPYGLSGESIPFIARMICLADSFDAMSSSRTYRSRLSRPDVMAEIRRCSGTQFDPELVEHFIALDFSEFDRLIEEHRAAISSSPEAAA